MFRILLFLVIAGCPLNSRGQHYLTNTGMITFYSHAAIEDITASNKKVSSGLNIASGEIAFSVNISSFIFPKKLMQEHFNEKYMESEKYPSATFTGRVEGYDQKAMGIQRVRTKGTLTIHGVSQQVEIAGTIENENDQIRLKSKFIVRLEDHKIAIPTMFWQNIAEQVEVRVEVNYPTK
jgi:polyisoprenoid-binding protein YceI